MVSSFFLPVSSLRSPSYMFYFKIFAVRERLKGSAFNLVFVVNFFSMYSAKLSGNVSCSLLVAPLNLKLKHIILPF